MNGIFRLAVLSVMLVGLLGCTPTNVDNSTNVPNTTHRQSDGNTDV